MDCKCSSDIIKIFWFYHCCVLFSQYLPNYHSVWIRSSVIYCTPALLKKEKETNCLILLCKFRSTAFDEYDRYYCSPYESSGWWKVCLWWHEVYSELTISVLFTFNGMKKKIKNLNLCSLFPVDRVFLLQCKLLVRRPHVYVSVDTDSVLTWLKTGVSMTVLVTVVTVFLY